MSELHLNIVEYKYPHKVSDQLLKDQYIFGVCIKEIQDHLLGEITPEDNSEKCLLESHKIESKIEQRKITWDQTSMIYDAIHQGFHGRDKSCGKSSNRNCSNSSSGRSCK